MKIKLALVSFMFLALATPAVKSTEPIKQTYTIIASDLSKAILAGYFIKFAYKLATSRIEICGHEIHKKSDSMHLKVLAEVLITTFEILRREWDGTADCCNAQSIFDDSKIFIKIMGKVIGMRMPIPFLKD